jgi:hypothetical protein
MGLAIIYELCNKTQSGFGSHKGAFIKKVLFKCKNEISNEYSQ